MDKKLGTAINANFNNAAMTLASRLSAANSGQDNFFSGDLNRLLALFNPVIQLEGIDQVTDLPGYITTLQNSINANAGNITTNANNITTNANNIAHLTPHKRVSLDIIGNLILTDPCPTYLIYSMSNPGQSISLPPFNQSNSRHEGTALHLINVGTNSNPIFDADGNNLGNIPGMTVAWVVPGDNSFAGNCTLNMVPLADADGNIPASRVTGDEPADMAYINAHAQLQSISQVDDLVGYITALQNANAANENNITANTTALSKLLPTVASTAGLTAKDYTGFPAGGLIFCQETGLYQYQSAPVFGMMDSDGYNVISVSPVGKVTRVTTTHLNRYYYNEIDNVYIEARCMGENYSFSGSTNISVFLPDETQSLTSGFWFEAINTIGAQNFVYFVKSYVNDFIVGDPVLYYGERAVIFCTKTVGDLGRKWQIVKSSANTGKHLEPYHLSALMLNGPTARTIITALGNMQRVIDCPAGITSYICGSFNVPKSMSLFSSNTAPTVDARIKITFELDWLISTLSTGNVVWAIQAVWHNNNAALNAAFSTPQLITSAAPTAVDTIKYTGETDVIVPAGTPSYPCKLEFRIFRTTNALSGGIDTFPGTASLSGVKIGYFLIKGNDA